MLEGIGPKVLVIFAIGLTIVLVGVGISTDIFTNQNIDKSLVIRAVGDIEATPERFVGQKVTVMGYYYQGDLPTGYGYITSIPVEQPIIQGSLNDVDFLIVNFTSFNVTFEEGTLYYFTGVWKLSQGSYYQGTSYSLVLKAIEQP
jgi:hypothetical protein